MPKFFKILILCLFMTYYLDVIEATEKSMSRKILFRSGEYKISQNAKEEIQVFARHAKSQTQQIAIHAPTSGLAVKSLPYILTQTRALKIFQALINEGIAAEKIHIISVAGNKNSSNNTIDIDLTSRHLSPEKSPTSNIPGEDVKELVIQFPTGLASPLNLSSEIVHKFVRSAVERGCQEITISGYADAVGPKDFNNVLAELRALQIYEMIAREETLPCLLKTQSFGAIQATRGHEILGGNQEDRKAVVVRVTQEKENAVAQQEKPREWGKVGIDLVPYVGMLQPGGKLSNNAKTGSAYGLGIGKALWSEATEGRLTLFVSGVSKMPAKQTDRAGPLYINFFDLRFDYAYGASTDSWRPFIGAGAGYANWQGTIKQPSTSSENTDKSADPSAFATFGLEAPIKKDLLLSPELSGRAIFGDFNEMLYSTSLSLRWRI